MKWLALCGFVLCGDLAEADVSLSTYQAGTLIARHDVNSIAVNSTRIFISTDRRLDGIWSIPIAGGKRVRLVGSEVEAHVFAADEEAVYASLRTIEEETDRLARVFRIPLDGGARRALFEMTTDDDTLAIDEDSVYFTNEGLFRMAKSGGPRTRLVSGVRSNAEYSPAGVALDSRYAYFTIPGALYRVPKHGGTAERIAPLRGFSDQLATRGNFVYGAENFTVADSSPIWRVPKSGGRQHRVVGDSYELPIAAFAMSARGIFLTRSNDDTGEVWFVPHR